LAAIGSGNRFSLGGPRPRRRAALQGKLLPGCYHRLFWTWFWFGFPAFGAVLAIFWLMIARPAIAIWPFGPAA